MKLPGVKLNKKPRAVNKSYDYNKIPPNFKVTSARPTVSELKTEARNNILSRTFSQDADILNVIYKPNEV